jgi:hypothetical protein
VSVAKFGKKTYVTLKSITEKGIESAKENYHVWIPTKQEMMERYNGIGIDAEGILLRPDLENTLSFANNVAIKAVKKVPLKSKFVEPTGQSLELKNDIITDIRLSGSANITELGLYYQRTEDDIGELKVSFLEKYRITN